MDYDKLISERDKLYAERGGMAGGEVGKKKSLLQFLKGNKAEGSPQTKAQIERLQFIDKRLKEIDRILLKRKDPERKFP